MRENLIDAAVGRIQPDIIIKNAEVADVFSHTFRRCDVAVKDGRIAGLGSYSGENEYDAEGKWLLPSFTDSHMHIESSMLTPDEYAKVVAPHGVTAVIADPHEITNVCGEAGLSFMLKRARGLPFDIHFMLPSCVPATDFEMSGAMIDSAGFKKLMSTGEYLGLGEMMNYVGVVHKNPWVMKKLAAGGPYLDGHSPGLSGQELCAYAAAGIRTDHECSTLEEMNERIACGMYVQIREGTQSRNLAALVPGITPRNLRRILFCTDDRYLGDSIKYGSISNCIDRAVELGVDVLDAVTIATLNAAECYGLRGKGGIAPGWAADFILCDGLAPLSIRRVYKGGELIAEDGKALFSGVKTTDPQVMNTVRLPEITPALLEQRFDPEMPVIQVMPHELITRAVHRKNSDGLNRCAVIERHKNTGCVGRCFVEGFGLRGGAIAQSVGHDSHNVSVLGDSPEDMALAVNALGTEGGMAVVKGGKLLYCMKLPVAGLMTDLPAAEALREHELLTAAADSLNMDRDIDPFMLLSFLPLPVIPDIRLTCQGLFDVNRFEFI